LSCANEPTITRKRAMYHPQKKNPHISRRGARFNRQKSPIVFAEEPCRCHERAMYHPQKSLMYVCCSVRCVCCSLWYVCCSVRCVCCSLWYACCCLWRALCMCAAVHGVCVAAHGMCVAACGEPCVCVLQCMVCVFQCTVCVLQYIENSHACAAVYGVLCSLWYVCDCLWSALCMCAAVHGV